MNELLNECFWIKYWIEWFFNITQRSIEFLIFIAQGYPDTWILTSHSIAIFQLPSITVLMLSFVHIRISRIKRCSQFKSLFFFLPSQLFSKSFSIPNRFFFSEQQIVLFRLCEDYIRWSWCSSDCDLSLCNYGNKISSTDMILRCDLSFDQCGNFDCQYHVLKSCPCKYSSSYSWFQITLLWTFLNKYWLIGLMSVLLIFHFKIKSNAVEFMFTL